MANVLVKHYALTERGGSLVGEEELQQENGVGNQREVKNGGTVIQKLGAGPRGVGMVQSPGISYIMKRWWRLKHSGGGTKYRERGGD